MCVCVCVCVSVCIRGLFKRFRASTDFRFVTHLLPLYWFFTVPNWRQKSVLVFPVIHEVVVYEVFSFDVTQVWMNAVSNETRTPSRRSVSLSLPRFSKSCCVLLEQKWSAKTIWVRLRIFRTIHICVCVFVCVCVCVWERERERESVCVLCVCIVCVCKRESACVWARGTVWVCV